MICDIEWKKLDYQDWMAKTSDMRRLNLLQSYPYGLAQAILNRQNFTHGLIKIDGEEAGLVQIQQVGLFKNAIHALVLDRGPLWFTGYGHAAHFAAFVAALDRNFPRRFGRRRRFIPEIEDTANARALLRDAGFEASGGKPYETIWIDLEQDVEVLRQNLKKNWRSTLVKAEKGDVTIQWDECGEYLPWLLGEYERDKAQKGYDGPSLKLLHMLSRSFAPDGNMLIGRALLGKTPIGAVLILRHGTGATYQIGWSGDAGRAAGAHYLLLWDALTMLQERGVKDFDLGGVNADGAKGVKQFKSGMGGTVFRLPGLYH